jgi:hypothetical protein
MRVQVQCITKSGRHNHWERIYGIGGVNPNGTPWWMTEDEAIAYIKSGNQFFVKPPGYPEVNVIIAKSQHGREYLKTEPDGLEANNLLALPECPR